MRKRKKENIEFRYYELPQNEWVLALTGEKWTRIYGRDVEGLHFHNLLEIGYCYAGIGDLILEDEHYRFSKEMISIIPANFLHTTVSDLDVLGTWAYLFIDIEGFLKELYKAEPLLVQKLVEELNKRAIFIKVEENERMAQLIKSILDEMVQKRKFYLESVKGMTWALLFEIIRMNESREEYYQPYLKNRMQIQNALEYVTQKYDTALRIEELAMQCHMSEPHFRRVFGKYMNMTPLEYIHLIRIQKACELLRKTNDSIHNIAIKVGYLTPSTFERNFKKLVGMLPNEWRNRADNYEGKLLNYNISTLRGW